MNVTFSFSTSPLTDGWLSPSSIFQAIGLIVAASTLIWAVVQHGKAVRLQKEMFSEQTLLQLTQAWNGAAMLEARFSAFQILDQFPAEGDASRWLMAEQKQQSWFTFGVVGHFLCNVEYLCERGMIKEEWLEKHIGGGAFWAHQLVCLYATIPDEQRVTEALLKFLRRYPERSRGKKLVAPPFPVPSQKHQGPYLASTWTGRS